ncbi:MAG TPA: Ig-like domain-containing protein [Gemmatimonadales bacterium]|nr:Ig-like domain-containing protein [Gemmatimonadales bacterium]
MIAPRLSAVLVVGLPLLYAACGSDNLTLPGEGEPAHIAIVSGSPQGGRVSTQLTEPLVVKVTDSKDRPVAGASVDFTFDDAAAGGSMNPTSFVTGADGLASTAITLGDQVGDANGHATVPVPQGTVPVTIAFVVTALPDNANGIAPVSGNEQSAPVGTDLPLPLVVQVTDQFFNPIAGVPVTWSVTGGGSVSQTSTVTGPDGKTQVTRTLGNTTGTQTTLATSEGLAGSPVTFTHNATAGSANRVVKLSGDGQSAVAGSELPNPLVVQVLDAQDNPVPNRAVTWVVGAGGGHPNPQNSTTDGEGKASTRWTLGAQGNNTLNAVVSGVGTATFTATATAGTPNASKSTVTASPRSIVAGATSTITVRVRDASGLPVRGASVTVTGSGTGNTVDPATDTSDDNGVATFAFGSTVAEVKTITAVAGGVTLDQKPTITVVRAQSRTRITGQNLATPTTAGTPVHVTFSVVSSEGGGTPTGPVTVFSEQEPSATCTVDVSAGACDLTLTVVGNHHLFANYAGDTRFEGSSDDDNHQVVPAPNPPPTAAFSHADCTAGIDCQFTDASTDNSRVAGWSWNFGDPASPNNLSTQQNPTHNFTLGGETQYTVTLIVTDDQGAQNTTSQTFNVH